MAKADTVAGLARLAIRDEGPVHRRERPVGDMPAGATPGRLSDRAPNQRHGGPTVAGTNAGASGGSGGASLAVHIGVSDEQGQRSHMEDRHTVITDFQLPGGGGGTPRQFAAVYDGHSCYKGSEHASRRLHEIIAEQPAVQQCTGQACDDAAVEAALKAAFQDADEEIVEAAVKKGRRYGTTAVCALRVGGTLYVAHAGDSRAVLCRSGKAITLTRDHKPASVPEERRRIEAQGGKIAYKDDRVHSNPEGQHHSRLNMSRALGDPDFKLPRRLVEAEPDVARVQLRPRADAFLLLGSDGLFDVMSDQEAVDAAAAALAGFNTRPSSQAAEAAADALVSKALKGGTSDNVTALLMLFDWA